MTEPTISCSFTGDFELTVAEVWPDGDAPDNPTAADVAKVMDQAGMQAILRDWNLEDNLGLDVMVGHLVARVR